MNFKALTCAALLLCASAQTGRVAAAETVTVNNSGFPLRFDVTAQLMAGLGATNDRLVKNGPGNIVVDPSARLTTTGLAGATPSPVLTVTGGGALTGTFAKTSDDTGAAVDFFTGSDIVTPDYTTLAGSLTLKQAGQPTTAGFEPDGDQYKVQVTGGTGLATLLGSEVVNSIRNRGGSGSGTGTGTGR